MNYREILQNTMQLLKDKGADKIELVLNKSDKEEFNLIYKELNLLRSVNSIAMNISIIKDHKQANTTLNQLDKTSIETTIDRLFVDISSASPDPAFDIAPFQEAKSFKTGTLEGDYDKLCDRLVEYSEQMKTGYPTVQFDGTMSYFKKHRFYLNSNGVDYEEQNGYYSFNTMFTAKEGKKMSSFNYTGFTFKDLDQPLLSMNFTDDLIKQITEQTVTKPIPENFIGDVILYPFVSMSMVEMLIDSQFGDSSLIKKTSKYPDHLEQKLFDEKLSLYATPSDPAFSYVSPVTYDGYLAVDAPILEKGVLKHYPISLFTANKVGKQRTIGYSGGWKISTGNTKLQDMIKDIAKGVLCVRDSGGSPNPNTDFSSVLKNSYYIENGKLQYPISETMMSANLIEMFNNIADISSETINDGGSIAPFIRIKDVNISRK